MFQNLVKSIRMAESFLGVIFQKSLGQVASDWAGDFIQMFLSQSYFDFLKIFGGKVIIAKGSRSSQQFINQNTKAIVIKLIWISFAVINFWWHGMSRTTYSKSPFFADILGFTQIDHSDFAFGVDHEIRGLNVSVDVAFFMERFHDESNLSDNQSSHVFVERTGHLEQLVERKAFYQLKQHVQFGFVLESLYYVVDARGLLLGEVQQGLFFVLDMLDALAVDEWTFGDRFADLNFVLVFHNIKLSFSLVGRVQSFEDLKIRKSVALVHGLVG